MTQRLIHKYTKEDDDFKRNLTHILYKTYIIKDIHK